MLSIYTAAKSCFKTDYRVYLAQSFLESLEDNKNTFYLMIGRDFEWPLEIDPPSPVSSLEDELQLRKNAIAFKKINYNDVSFVISKQFWTYGKVYDKYNESNLENNCCVVVKNYINGQHVYSIFLCVERPEDYSRPSLIEPKYNNLNSLSYIYNSDGYDWVLLYQFSEIEYRKFSTDNWIGIPDNKRATGIQKTIISNAYKRSVPYYNFYKDNRIDVPINGFGANSIYQLSAYQLLISVSLSSNMRKISNTIKFRQIALWINPSEKVSSRKALKDSYTANEIDLSTGNILYFENRRAIQRNVAQTENIKILLGC